jgi:peptidoglycan/xylan/chitin deacetylase (PgdA/CDA1 family)
VSTELNPVVETLARRHHLEQSVRVWLGLPRSADVDTPRLPTLLERRFLRIEEYERPGRDAWGCWDHSYSENFLDGTLGIPEVDRWLVAQRDELRTRTPLEPLWPPGKDFAVCLTHDVDVLAGRSTPRQVVRHATIGLRRGGSHDTLRYARPPIRAARALRGGFAFSPSTRNTIELSSALEHKYEASSSYFFTVPPAGGGSRYDCTYAPSDNCTFRGARTTVADLIRALADDGFDVGLHGSYHSATDPGVLATERATFQHATGITPTTTRQHFLHWDITRTPQLQNAAGFTADSTLGFNRTVGFRASTALPFRQFDVVADEELALLEVPLVIEDSALLGPIAVRGGLDHARERVQELVDTTREVGGAMTFLFHPDKLLRPEWLELYEWSLRYLAESGAWLTSLSELERWWTVRERRLLDG